MNTTISVSLPSRDAIRVRETAKQRGFPSTSEYLRFLLEEGQHELIGEDELLKRATRSERLYKQGKLKKLTSLADLDA